MSPTEKDLRAALRRDEGDGLDPDVVVAAGRSRAAYRRNRIAAVTGVTVAVLAVGTTAGLLLGTGGSDGHSSSSNADAGASSGLSRGGGQPAPATAPSAAARSAASAADARAARAAAVRAGSPSLCPATFSTPTPTAGGGSGIGTGSAAALFAEPVTTVVVCGYGNTGSGTTVHPSTLVLSGSDATRLVSSLDGAAMARPRSVCPMYRTGEDHRLVFLGVTADTTILPPVSTTLGNPPCTVQVSNGSTVRYAWEPPADLQSKLYALRPTR